MKSNLYLSLAGLAAMLFVAGTLAAQTMPAGYTQDWSNRHVVFSNPGTYEDAVHNGTVAKWLKITSDPRYIIQQRARSGAAGVSPNEVVSPSPKSTKVKKDWSTGLGGLAATLIGTVGTLNSSSISGSSTLDVAGTTLTASAPTAASATGTFTGNPTNSQTVTIGGSEVLTASLSTAATAAITVGSSFCFAPGQGVDVDGTTFTTNATVGTGTFTVSTVPSAGDTVVIGGVTYTFETTLSGTTPANQVLVPSSNSSTNRHETAQNLAVAINNTGTCGFTSSGVCTRNVSASNSMVSSTDTSGTSTQTLTALCADNATITNTPPTDNSVTFVNVAAASSAGTNSASGKTFALNTSGSSTTPPSQTQTAANLITVINGNSTTSAIVTASSGGTGIVTLTANTWGTAANSYTLSDTATSGVTLTAFAGGTAGTNTGTSFAIDNVNSDAATNLAAAIARNGGTVGVTATSAGAVVTVTATTPGTGGNSIALAEGLSGFTWSGSDLGSGSDGTNSNTTFAYWSVNTFLSSAQVATNIANAINANTTLQGSTGVSAAANTPANGDVTFTANVAGTAANSYAVTPSAFSAFTGGTLSGGSASPHGTVQPNSYPAKFSFSTSGADCTTDFLVYPTGTAIAATSASIAAYNNLYSGCVGAVPSVLWSYSTGGIFTTSPILSFDSTGSQVAFIQENSSGSASLVLLKWAASTSGALTTQSSASAYRSCTAPCMYTLTFGDSHSDTLSSPFYDYHGDALYVGDDSGDLHQFTGVFNGTPAENTTSPWPVTLGTNKLSSPVYDGTWNEVFVGDVGGVLHCVTASTGAIFGTITPATGGQIADAPLIDSSANYVIAFVNSSTSNSVYGFSEQFFPDGEGGPVPVGTGATGYYLYAGTFDNVYYQSSDHTGNIYVVGNTGVTTGATLYQVPVSGGFLAGTSAAVVTGLTPSSSGAYPWPSPVTEFCNPGSASACALNAGGTATTTGTDYVFFSVNRGAKGGCTNTAGNGCVLSYNVSTPTAVAISGSGLGVTTPSTGNGCWATGGIVIDNSVQTGTLAGTSEIYLVNLDGNAAGSPSAATSANCGGTAASAVINGVQASQASP